MSSDNFRLLASMSETGNVNNIDYRNRMVEAYQSKVTNKFDQSTSTRIVQEEYPYGSGRFRDLICRVVSVRTVGTGSKMSDSYKTIIFKNQNNDKGIGFLYKFEDNYWIACNSDIMSSQSDSIVVRRCNNILRWMDSNGKVQSVPISFEEEAFYLNNEVKQEVDSLNGYRKAIIQRTELTKTLLPNQRFIFGNKCLKLSGSGINDFLNQSTEDDDGASVIKLNFEYDFPNEATDDMENKIANAYSNEFSINIDQKSTNYALSSNQYVFTATVLKNEEVITPGLAWTVNSTSNYTASQNNNKLNIVFGSIGEYEIVVRNELNPTLNESITINITNVDTYEIRYTPITDVIYKGDTNSFTFGLYKNDSKVNDAVIVFEKIDTLSTDYYTYSVNGNILSITNNKMTSKKINFECTVSNYSNVTPYTFNMKLGGVW